MSWHLFAMVWGDVFVERFRQLAVPFLAMPGNVPALKGDVTFHIYTDPPSRAALDAALAPLAPVCSFDIRDFDAAAANGLSGPDYKYEIQRRCVHDLARRVAGETIVLLDSNFVLADGALRFLAERRAQGYLAASVSVLRVSTGPFSEALARSGLGGQAIGSRALMDISTASAHHITESFFVDAARFTPYPSQVSWRVGGDGFVNRNFLPHPLMIPADPKVALYQSTMDYELILRVASDERIYVCRDSDEVLAVKFSDDTHQAERTGDFRPTAEDIGLFLLTCTNRRHRLFADVANVFHAGPRGPGHENAVAQSQQLIDEAYAWIDRLAAHAGRLDARLLMYLKSHLGPIEDFMSPQLEPSALGQLT